MLKLSGFWALGILKLSKIKEGLDLPVLSVFSEILRA